MQLDVWQQAQLEAELMDNAVLMCRVIESFLSDLPTALAAIDNALLQNDSAALAKASHYLHGSAAQLQLSALAHCCKTLQSSALQQHIDVNQVAALKAAATLAQTTLEHYLSQQNRHHAQ